MSISPPRLNRPGPRLPGRWARAGLLALVAVSPVLVTETVPATTAPSPTAPYAPDRVIVAYEDGVSESAATAIEEGVGAVLEDRIGPETRLLSVPPGSVEATVSGLSADPRVRYAEPDYYVYPASHDSPPDDPLFHEQRALDNTGQLVRGYYGTPGADIKALRAWEITTGSSDVVVGILDTGINLNHPDLVGNLWSNPGGLTIGGDTCDKGTHGYDFVDHDCVPNDTDSHGTRAAGVVGAHGDNGEGVTGINWDVSLLALRLSLSNSALNETGGLSEVAEGVWWAVDAADHDVNIRVLSMSFSTQGSSGALRDAIAAAGDRGILAVAAAGNDGRDLDAGGLKYPCGYDLDNVICVTATTSTDQQAPGTNWGTTSVDLGAPGHNNRSTGLGDEYMYFGATSGATPHVAGAAALVFSEFPSLTPQQVRAKILNNVDPLPSLQGKVVTGGRLNLYEALRGPVGETTTPTTSPPTTTPPSSGGGGSGGAGGGSGATPTTSPSGSKGSPATGGGTDGSSGKGDGSTGRTGGNGGSRGASGPNAKTGRGAVGGTVDDTLDGLGEDVLAGGLLYGDPPRGGVSVTYDEDGGGSGAMPVAVGTAFAALASAGAGLWRRWPAAGLFGPR